MESEALIILRITQDPDPQADAQFSQKLQADARLTQADLLQEQARQDKAQERKAEEDRQRHAEVRSELHQQAKDQENHQTRRIRLGNRNRQGNSPTANSPTAKDEHFPKVLQDQEARQECLQSREHLDPAAVPYQVTGLKTERRKYAGNC